MGFFEHFRRLTGAERTLAESVFLSTLPYGRIMLGDHTGLGGAPWTEYMDVGFYVLHMGASAFTDATSSASIPGGFGVIRETFIHELTHVWQGAHSFFHGGYMVRSVLSQARAIVTTGDRNNAYAYTAGQAWSSYNVEQQANIVEDWFAGGASTSSPLFQYIRDNIRT